MNLSLYKNEVRRILVKVNECKLCLNYANVGIDILHKEIALKYINKIKIPIKVMFIAESPPKYGNGFFYDESQNSRFRNKLFKLINSSNLPKVSNISDFNLNRYYLADSVNCRWDKSYKTKLPNQILKNCSQYLENQINLLRPQCIVTLGNYANSSITIDNIRKIITNNEINIINMSFILTASNETDDERIKKLNSIIL